MHKMTSKRQVTIPKSVCTALGLEPGDMIEVFARDGVAHLVRMSNKSLAGEFAGMVHHKSIPSADEMKQAIKSRAALKYQATDDCR